MPKIFQRKVEDFVCQNCGNFVKGNGYTNHCPSCLYSKHVDINPGDRLAECQGLMKPISAEYKQGKFVIKHKCVDCGYQKLNRADDGDDQELLVRLTTAITNI